MLYKLQKSPHGHYESLKPIPFEGLPKEKELEDLLAANLWDVLFEAESRFQNFPIFQERSWQPESDIYALNRQGDVVIYELKRDSAGASAVHQALRYCEKASRYSYDDLQNMLRKYKKDADLDLRQEHQAAFELERPLDIAQFNRHQHLVIIGTGGDAELVRNIDYWKSRGLSIEFIPYRVYRIKEGGKEEFYFEFFSIPYDTHSNPAHTKGVIFDTNYTWDEDGIWYMCENERVAAFGGIKTIVGSLNPNDTVFLYHKGVGIVAAGVVRGKVEDDDEWDACYRKLKWLTPVPKRDAPMKGLSAAEIRAVMGYGFFWAKTMKPPYLTADESKRLVEAVVKKIT